MATSASPIFPKLLISPVVQILPADTTTLKTLDTAGADGTRIDAIYVSSTDTVARDIAVYLTISGVDYLLSTVQIPANAGNINTVPMVSLFAHSQFAGLNQDINGNKELTLASGAVLKVKALVTVTATRAIQFTAIGGDY